MTETIEPEELELCECCGEGDHDTLQCEEEYCLTCKEHIENCDCEECVPVLFPEILKKAPNP